MALAFDSCSSDYYVQYIVELEGGGNLAITVFFPKEAYTKTNKDAIQNVFKKVYKNFIKKYTERA